MPTTVEQLIREAANLEVTSIEKVASKFDKNEAKKVSEGLIKVASLPYKEEVYNSVQEIMKIASSSLNSMIDELDDREKSIIQLTKVAEVREVIDTMLEHGIISKYDVQEKTAELLNRSERELSIVKEAIALGNGTSKNIFFESEKTASTSNEKRGIFDGVNL